MVHSESRAHKSNLAWANPDSEAAAACSSSGARGGASTGSTWTPAADQGSISIGNLWATGNRQHIYIYVYIYIYVCMFLLKGLPPLPPTSGTENKEKTHVRKKAISLKNSSLKLKALFFKKVEI